MGIKAEELFLLFQLQQFGVSSGSLHRTTLAVGSLPRHPARKLTSGTQLTRDRAVRLTKHLLW